MQMSQLHLYSKATVAENLVPRQPDDPEFRKGLFIPDEHMSFLDGELRSNPTVDTVSGVDALGNQSQTKVTTDMAVEAIWLPHGSNRLTPPDLRRGEKVNLYRFADLPTFYWQELGDDDHLRAQETAIFAFKADPSNEGATPSQENAYWLEVSGHKGTVTFSTSKKNGEKTAHTVQFDPMRGQFVLQDDLGQMVKIDSIAQLIHMVNAKGTEVTLDQQNINMHCDDTLSIEAVNAINIKTKTFHLTATDGTFDITNLTVNTTTTTLKASTASITADSVNVASPNIKLGAVTIANGVITGVVSLAASGSVTAPNLKYN